MRYLTHGPEAAVLVQTFYSEVENGGFEQYFHNSSGERTPETWDALVEFGAEKEAELLGSAASLVFPKGIVPRSDTKRRHLLANAATSTVQALGELDKSFYALKKQCPLVAIISRYITAHEEEFFLD